MPRPLDRAEEALAALLGRAGLRAGEARCLVALLRGQPLTREDASGATDLAPQDVSVAMRALELAGAVRVEPVPREGRGRPLLRYRLDGGASDVLLRLDATRRARLEEELAALDALRARAATV